MLGGQTNMIKKTIIALSIALGMIATPVFADSFPLKFYIGGHGGGTFADVKFEMDSDNGTNIKRIVGNKGQDILTGGAFAGFLLFFNNNNMFTGFEVEGNWDDMKVKLALLDSEIGDPWNFEIKRRWQIITSVLFGSKPTEDTTFYIKLGAGISNFQFSEGIGEDSENTNTKNIVHFVPALGAEYELDKNLAIRLEVSGEIIGGHPRSNSATGGVSQNTKARYESVSAKLGFLVKDLSDLL